MLSIASIYMTVHGFCPISDNASGIIQMCQINEAAITGQALDSSGNIAASMTKTYSTCLSCLVAFSTFAAFATRVKLYDINIMQPLQLSGLLIGAMLPYLFSSMTLKAVGSSAIDMMNEIKS